MKEKEHKCLVHKKLKDEAINILNELGVKGFYGIESEVILSIAKTVLSETLIKYGPSEITVMNLSKRDKGEVEKIVKKALKEA